MYIFLCQSTKQSVTVYKLSHPCLLCCYLHYLYGLYRFVVLSRKRKTKTIKKTSPTTSLLQRRRGIVGTTCHHPSSILFSKKRKETIKSWPDARNGTYQIILTIKISPAVIFSLLKYLDNQTSSGPLDEYGFLQVANLVRLGRIQTPTVTL